MVLAVIVLFVGTGVFPTIGGNILKSNNKNADYYKFNELNSVENPKTIYVDDDNTEGPWYGTQQHPYKNIHDALINSVQGDTIIVYSGVYHGYNPFPDQVPILRIDKSVNLIGQEVNGQGKPLVTTCIVIAPEIFQTGTTDYTKVSNFCIEYPYDTLLYDAIHVGSSSFIEISNCNITASGYLMGGMLLLRANGSIIKNNVIYDCHGSGIYVSNSNNIVFLENEFNNNSGWGGIFFDNYGNGANHSIICHNRFIDNSAWDICNNTWYNSMMSTGNYWYNYEGEDKDGDGIGDIPYNITGEGKSQDLYPLMKPWSGRDNQPPEKPTINGPSNGNAGVSYEYKIHTSDPDGDNIRYLVNWGDNSIEWSKTIFSDGELILNHIWKAKGSYMIKLRAFDSSFEFSDWTTLSVSMSKSKMVNSPFIQFIKNLLQNHPHLYPLLRLLLQGLEQM